ncbi:MAG: hypothetical protein KF775_11530 [Cyclobacteriaceae bacterium]|nr:hypothetical protein [Cyclobacteriaceae bacterium]
MKYELETLEALIIDFSSDMAISTSKRSKQLIEALSNEGDRIKSSFMRIAFSSIEDKHIERHFQNHQQALIRLTDQVQNYLSVNDRPEVETLYQRVSSSLEDLLTYIEKHFSKYFDLSAKIPESYRRVVANEFDEKLRVIQIKFLNKEMNKNLIGILLRPFECLKSSIDSHISFKKLIYLKEFYSELDSISNIEAAMENLMRQVCISMIYLNFNSLKMFNYCVMKIKNEYQEKENLNEQLKKLAHYMKIINQQQEKPGFSYKPGHKTLKVQLLEWVAEEIIYLERKHQLSFVFKSEKPDTTPHNYDFKLLTDLSVPKVAYFVRILIETGLIKNQNILEVIRFFANSVSTNRVGTISAESFRTKFYNTEDSAKAAVESDVLMLLDHIRKSK